MIVQVTRANALLIVFVRQIIHAPKTQEICAVYIQIYVGGHLLYVLAQTMLLYPTG